MGLLETLDMIAVEAASLADRAVDYAVAVIYADEEDEAED